MVALVKAGGKQYAVSEGDTVFVERLGGASEGDTVTLNEVIAVIGDNGDSQFGKPFLSGASVTASVVKNGRGRKIKVFKYNSKKNYRRLRGHRQPYTRLQIQSISVAG